MNIASKSPRDIFFAAIERPATQRAAFLDEACSGDSELRRRVDAMVRAHDEAGAFLSEPGPSPNSTANYTPGWAVTGAVVAGRYKLLEQIGDGGMGAVWMAEQREPVKRLVAVKLIKPGMDSRDVLARFEAERQALAMMDHPNIAKVLDGGAADDGRPFFVMELVKGLPLTEYCDSRRLPVNERLNLFLQICSAVQHAHQKGVIHRDLKPSNVLITEHDGRPTPKVIDFGLAKALNTVNLLTERTLHTAYGAVVGTPLYMAPEQVGINALDVDTRTDIYTLGVILYELLAGSTPLEKGRFKEVMWVEVQRLIREEEPPRPSTRLSSSANLPSVAASRGVEPAQLPQLVRGELDWIVMKALEKDRARRYETANGFAMDVQRYLAGDPVLAVPPSTTYRLRKFARRHRAALATAFTIAALITSGVVASVVEAVRADRAEASARAAEKAALDDKQVAQAVRDFLLDKILGQTAPRIRADATPNSNLKLGVTKENPTVREILDRAASELGPERINASFPGQPIVQAEILLVVGSAYRELGEYPKAKEFLSRARALFDQYRGPNDPRSLVALCNFTVACADDGDLPTAISLAEETRSRMGESGAADADIVSSMANLATTYGNAGRLDLAMPLFSETIARAKATLGPYDARTFRLTNNFAVAYVQAGKPQAALAFMEEAVQQETAKLGPDHPDTITGMNILAGLYERAGDLNRAIPLCESALQLSKTQFGRDNPETLLNMASLANLYGEANKPDRAAAIAEEALEISKTKLGADHHTTIEITMVLATVYQRMGKSDRGIEVLKTAIELQTARAGANDPLTLEVRNELAVLYAQAGQPALAMQQLEDVRRRLNGAPETANLSSVAYLSNLAQVYRQTGQPQRAIELIEEFLAKNRGKLDFDDPVCQSCLQTLAENYLAVAAQQAWLGRETELSETCRRALKLAKDTTDPVIAERVAKACILSTTADSARLAAALTLARKAVELGEKHAYSPYFQATLGMAEYRNGDYEAAARAIRTATGKFNNRSAVALISAVYLAMARFHQGDRRQAAELFGGTASQVPPEPHDKPEMHQHDELILWLACREAATLIQSGTATASAKSKSTGP